MVHESSDTPPTLREARRAETTERILDTAERLLGTEGMGALTMQRLAADLGFTVGATYRYFASKEAILAALQRRVFHGLAEDLAASLERELPDRLARIAVVARHYTTLGTRRPLHAQLLSRMLGEPENVLDAGHAAPNAALALEIGGALVRELGGARAAGSLGEGNDVERALVLWASLAGIAQTRKLERWQVPGLAADALADEALRALLVGWGAEPRAARRAIETAHALVPGASPRRPTRSRTRKKEEKKR